MTRVRKRGIEIAYDDVGEGDVPMILIHGFPFNRSLWREQVPALAKIWRVITPDLRGHGESSVTDGVVTMEMMAEDVGALMDELGVTRAVIGGLSMGGYVALSFYRLFPDRVRALVLADTRPQADSDENRRTREETAQRALREGMESIVESMLPKLLSPATLSANRPLVERVREMILGNEPEGAAAALRGMAVRQDQTELLPQIDVPALILVGSDDAITPPSDSETMANRIPNARMEVIEHAGHVSNLECSEQFNRAMKEFLSELSAVKASVT